MGGVVSGFAVIGAIVVVGYLLGRFAVLGDSGRDVLAKLAFAIASPALLFQLMAQADLGILLSRPLLVQVLSTLTVFTVFGLAGWWRRWGVARTTVGALGSGYVNAANLGIPIAVYVLGDATVVAPVMLVQLLIYTPIALTVLDLSLPGKQRSSGWRLASTPIRTPLVLGAAGGLLVGSLGLQLWEPVSEAIGLIAGMAVPAMLLAYGISLFGATAPGRGADRAPVWLAVVLKLVVQPVIAWVLGTVVFGFDSVTLLGVVVVAALPAAQNVFTYAWRYHAGVGLARDAVLLTTAFAPVSLLTVAALLG